MRTNDTIVTSIIEERTATRTMRDIQDLISSLRKLSQDKNSKKLIS